MKTNQVVALRISEIPELSYGSSRWDLEFILVDTSTDKAERPAPWSEDERPYAELKLSAYIYGPTDYRAEFEISTFGANYEGYRVNLDDIRRMRPTLEKIDRAVNNSPLKPTTFGQFVALTCQALKVKFYARESSLDKGKGFYDMHFNLEPIKDIQGVIDYKISRFKADWTEKHKPVAAEAA